MKNESIEVEFLNCIYKNAEMGLIGINTIITKVSSKKFEKILQHQKEEYDAVCTESESILKKYGEQNAENGTMAKVSAVIMSEVSLLKDKSDKKVAKMMMEGTNKGIIEITEKINKYSDIDDEILILANKLKEILESNVEELKRYL